MDALEFLANFDWVNSTRALLETFWHGPFAGHTFYIGLDSGWGGARCTDLLHERGITTYAHCIANGDAFFTVPREQAAEAEMILLQAGVPLKYHRFTR